MRFLSGKSTFIRNFASLLTANVLVVVVQLISTPIISRIYSPEDYGAYAIINVFIQNIGLIGALGFTMVYLIPKSTYEFFALGKLVISWTLLLGLLLTGFFLIIGPETFGVDEWYIVILLSFIFLFNPLNNVITTWNTRNGRFVKTGSSSVISILISKISVLTWGTISPSFAGLVAGDLARPTVRSFLQLSYKKLLIIWKASRRITWKYMFQTARKYSYGPKFIFPTQLLERLTVDALVFLIGYYYGSKILGSYAFAGSILAIVLTVVERTLQPIIIQKASFSVENQGVRKVFFKTFPFIASIILLGILTLGYASPFLFPFVFGDEWSIAADVVLILSLRNGMFFIQLIYSKYWSLVGMDARAFKLNTWGIVFKLSPFALPLIGYSFLETLYWYSLIAGMHALFMLFSLIQTLSFNRKAITVIFPILLVQLLNALGVFFFLHEKW